MYPVLVDEEIYEPEVYDEYTQGFNDLGELGWKFKIKRPKIRFKPFKAVSRALPKFKKKKRRKIRKARRYKLRSLKRVAKIAAAKRKKITPISCNLTKYNQILAQMKNIYENNQKIVKRNQQILNENKKIYQQNQKIVNEFKTLLKQYGLL